MNPEISVIITTLNPNARRLRRTLAAILGQSLPQAVWELVLVDNCSAVPLTKSALELDGHDNVILLREERLGLAFGRLAGIERARGAIHVFVDDDNVLQSDYLERTLEIFTRLPKLGLGGGKSLPEWEDGPPPSWSEEFFPSLAIRDLGEHEFHAPANFDHPTLLPPGVPIGAGMIARRAALSRWIDECKRGVALPGRRGAQLSSGEDVDMSMSAVRDGWEVGYFPQLVLTHLMPSWRTSKKYLGRLEQAINRSSVALLAKHGLRPWPPAAPITLPLRKARAFVRCRAWRGPAQYVRWRGLCGLFDGRMDLRSGPRVTG